MNLLTDEEILAKDCLDLKYDAFDNADIIPETILSFARAIEAAVLAKFEIAGYQWLDTAHFRKNIPSYATEYEWTPLYRKVDA